MTNRILVLGILATLLWRCQLSAAPPPVSAEDLARILQSPATGWQVSDETDRFKLPRREDNITVHRFLPAERPLIEVWVETGPRGLLWNSEVVEHLATYGKRLEEAVTLGTNAVAVFHYISGERLQFGETGRGYVSWSGSGPRGVCFRVVGTFPSMNRDIAVSISPSEIEVPDVTAEEQAWRAAVFTNYTTMLRGCLDKVVSQLSDAPVKAIQLSWNQDETGVSSSQSKPSAHKRIDQKQAEAKKDGTTAANEASGKERLLLSIGIAALVIIVWFLLKGRFR